MIKTHKRINSRVNFFYPNHGHQNILRRVSGVVTGKGNGLNGPFLIVLEDCGTTKKFLTKKIVQF